MSSVLSEFLQQLFTLIFTACVVVLVGGKLAWALLLFVPVVLSSARRVGRRVRHTTRHGQDKLAEIQNILHETITGNRIVKAFSMERWEMGRFEEAARRLFRANLRSVRAQAISSPLMDAIGAVAIAFLLLLGRGRIHAGTLTAGTFIAFIIAVFKLYDPIRKFTLFYNNFQQALGASGNIFDFMDEQDDVAERPHAIAIKSFRESIELEHVSFHYRAEEGGEQEVLSDINLSVRRGEVVALVGPSGAGKSTLVNLILRLFDSTEGTVKVGGVDVHDLDPDVLWHTIGLVPQRPYLFSGTVASNLQFGKPDATEEEMWAALEVAQASDFVRAMPGGLNARIEQGGTNVSGGQRQRLSIARALIRRPDIYVFDDSFSALDLATDARLRAALGPYTKDAAVVIVAQRVSTIATADNILVLEDGAVIGRGTHDELIRDCPTYAEIVQSQIGEKSAA
jgi:subfamily B ATP-binding cassette protein MsbA